MNITQALFFIFLLALPNLTWATCPNEYFTEECTCDPPHNGYCIAAGLKELTYFKMAEDLSNIISPDAGIPLKTLEGGSVKNIKRMRWQEGVKFVILQSDILEFFREEEARGNKIAGEIIEPLRVVTPLHNEEIHILVRNDSDIKTFHDIENKKIAVGPSESASATTAKAIYKYMFDKPIEKENIFNSSIEDALRALAIDKNVDVWVTVSGQPAAIFKKMKKEANTKIKLISFNQDDPKEKKILTGPYFKSSIKKESYPWLDTETSTIAVKAFLITQAYSNQKTKSAVNSVTQSLCKKFNDLKIKGHPKWKEVSLEKITLPGGWKYSDDVLAAFESSECQVAGVTPSPHEKQKGTSKNPAYCSG